MFWLLILIHDVPPLSDLFYGRTKDLPPLLAAHNRPRPAFIWPCQGRPKGARRAEGPLPGQIRRYNEKSAEAVFVIGLLFILIDFYGEYSNIDFTIIVCLLPFVTSRYCTEGINPIYKIYLN